MAREKSLSPAFKAFAAAGVLAAALIAVLVNVLVARFYKRWDWTSEKLYTLSPATIETLHGLGEPLEVIVFLSQSDPLSVSVRHMLSAYGAETTKLRPRYVDPDRNPAEFLALQQKYGIVAGKTEDGRVVTDASLVVARGDKHWFVTTEDMVGYDENDGRQKPKLEQALTEAIRNLEVKQSTKICFSAGHEEISIEDGGPNGVGELRFRLTKNNYDVVAIDLSAPNPTPKLPECHVVAMIGPENRITDKIANELSDYVKQGGNLLILVNPMLDEDNRMQPTGLEPVGRLLGIEFSNDFIIETSEQARVPAGLGETFFAEPKPHGITNGLLKDDKPRFRVVVRNSMSLKLSGAAQPLLSSSGQAFSVKDIRPFVEQGKAVERSPSDAGGPFVVAAAVELTKPPGSKAAHGPRALIAGSANLAWSQNWREPPYIGNRLFMESAVSWLAARPALVSVPEKPSHDAGLSLTEDSLGEVLRYVLIYMPAASAALGLFVMLRRRTTEKKSRQEKRPDAKKKPKKAAEDDDATEDD